MPEIHLRQPGFTYSACRPLRKNKETQKFKETGDSRYIYQNKVDIACCQHDMVYPDFTYLSKRKASDKVLYDKAFNIAKNPKYNAYKCRLALMVQKFFDKKSSRVSTSGGTINSKIMSNQELAKKLYKTIITNMKKEKYTHLLKTTLGALILLIYN